MTDAKIGHGAKFLVAPVSDPTNYVELAEVTSINPPPMVRDIIDATHMASSGRWREFIPGLKDGGEVTLTLNFVPSNATTLRLLEAQTEDDPSKIKIEFPDGEQWGFTAFCTNFSPVVPVDDKMTADVTWKVTGEPDFTDPS